MASGPHTFLRRIADGELRFNSTLEIFRPYSFHHVKRNVISSHSWFIVTLKESPVVYTVILIPKDIVRK